MSRDHDAAAMAAEIRCFQGEMEATMLFISPDDGADVRTIAPGIDSEPEIATLLVLGYEPLGFIVNRAMVDGSEARSKVSFRPFSSVDLSEHHEQAIIACMAGIGNNLAARFGGISAGPVIAPPDDTPLDTTHERARLFRALSLIHESFRSAGLSFDAAGSAMGRVLHASSDEVFGWQLDCVGMPVSRRLLLASWLLFIARDDGARELERLGSDIRDDVSRRCAFVWASTYAAMPDLSPEIRAERATAAVDECMSETPVRTFLSASAALVDHALAQFVERHAALVLKAVERMESMRT